MCLVSFQVCRSRASGPGTTGLISLAKGTLPQGPSIARVGTTLIGWMPTPTQGAVVTREALGALVLMRSERSGPRACELGIAFDTTSEEVLVQVLAHGVDPKRVVTTAAIKTEALLRAAIGAGVTIVLDNDDELEPVLHLAESAGAPVPIALRFGGFHLDDARLSTRFGFDVGRGVELGARLAGAAVRGIVRLEGVHFRLDGYRVPPSDTRSRWLRARDPAMWCFWLTGPAGAVR